MGIIACSVLARTMHNRKSSCVKLNRLFTFVRFVANTCEYLRIPANINEFPRAYSMFDKAKRKIDLVPEPDRPRFCRALRISVKGDGNLPPDTASPDQIEEHTGYSVYEQYNYGIVVGKTEAIQFLRDLGFDVREKGFKRRTTGKRYKQVFDRKVAKVGQKLVFSYLEILKMEGISVIPDLPKKIEKYE